MISLALGENGYEDSDTETNIIKLWLLQLTGWVTPKHTMESLVRAKSPKG